jgi:hypothetical protein
MTTLYVYVEHDLRQALFRSCSADVGFCGSAALYGISDT